MRIPPKTLLLLLGYFAVCLVPSVEACTRGKPFSFDELFAADVIVRATAQRYITEPDLNMRTTGTPDSTVEFKVEEVLKGAAVPEKVVLNGYLSDRDDFNDVRIPYKFVRPGGRHGSCFANTYKQKAQFLLFLKKGEEGYTPNISALGPTNEQLRSEHDPWLTWVKVRLNPCIKLDEWEIDLATARAEEFYQVWRSNPRQHYSYRAAKCYLQRFPNGDAELTTHLKKWVAAYEKAEMERQ